MELPTQILLTYGYLLLFAWVLVEQLGVPLPATPVLLAAGALSAQHELSFPLALLAGVAGCIIADFSWFVIGRQYGHHVLRILCKLSLEPTICVRRTQNSFGRRGDVTLLFAKFVPGLATLAPPVAGQNGMRLSRFLFFDTLGALAWVGAILGAGRLFGDALKRDPGLLNWVGRFSGALLVLGVLAFFLTRLYRRRRFMRKLVQSRLEPDELKRQIDAGESVFIVDLRHPLELVPDPYTLPGALHLSPELLTQRIHEIPRDRDIVLYCTCPNEATAAKMAMTLHRAGIDRVRPLRGGFDEWKRLGYPLDAVSAEMSVSSVVHISPAS
ncbi:MAG TPA: DedA family protein/thiosulfate sulfurtransferase GlpE [Terracidiphilus sp.]|jgi:membrane protein DedA with SNARE-associated domain/rhodanese-related sulfurtransferase|nr:DedA family protein/thiosulfate sulfurtransferase GlpE [Terracidiphilus sp.]